MRDYWGDTMLERFQPDPVGLPTIWATRTLRDIRISVYAPGTTTLQTIYSARTGGTTKGNPFTTGDDGYADFYAESGGYDIKMEDTQGPARIATKTIFWSAVNGEAGGIPPTQIAPGITQAQLDAAITAALWKPGDIKAQAMGAVPTGWLACDGQAVSRSTYSALFAAIGTTWGVGDNSTTFNVPDLKGRALSHVGAPTGDATGTTHALGTRFGAEQHKLIAAEGAIPAHSHAHALTTDSKGSHSHTGKTGGSDRSLAHSHGYNDRQGTANRGNPANFGGAQEYGAYLNHIHGAAWIATGGADTPDHLHSISADGAHTHVIGGTITASTAVAAVNNHNNLGPRAAVTCIVKT